MSSEFFYRLNDLIDFSDSDSEDEEEEVKKEEKKERKPYTRTAPLREQYKFDGIFISKENYKRLTAELEAWEALPEEERALKERPRHPSRRK